MQIWPAIDLLDGKCVRLEQGDYARQTVFGDDPAAMSSLAGQINQKLNAAKTAAQINQ